MAKRKEKGQGYVYLQRKLLQSAIWQYNEPFDRRSAWVDLILRANYEDREVMAKNSVITVHRGQHLESVTHIAKRWKWSQNKVRRFFRMLVDANMITTDGTPGGTLITLINYDKMQHGVYAGGSPDGTPDG